MTDSYIFNTTWINCFKTLLHGWISIKSHCSSINAENEWSIKMLMMRVAAMMVYNTKGWWNRTDRISYQQETRLNENIFEIHAVYNTHILFTKIKEEAMLESIKLYCVSLYVFGSYTCASISYLQLYFLSSLCNLVYVVCLL